MKPIQTPTTPPHSRGRISNFSLRSGFAVRDASDVAEIRLYDEIGVWGVTASAFRDELDLISAPSIRLSINSPGGDVFDGIAIYNDLLRHPASVTVDVTGVAASAASVVAMAGDEIRMAPNAFVMIHNAWGVTIGNADDMRDTAATLEQIDGALAATYAARTGGDAAEIATMMSDETWLDADAAVELGFADTTIEPAAGAENQAAALFDLSAFARTPGPLKRSIEAGLRDAGFSRKEAVAATATGLACQNPRDADDGLADLGLAIGKLIGRIKPSQNDKVKT